jgi:hypothetical protein
MSGKPRQLQVINVTDIGNQKYSRRYRQALKVLLASPVDGFVSDVLPILTMNAYGRELDYPEDVLGIITDNIGASAGNFSRVCLANPAGSGILAVVTYVAAFGLGASMTVNIGIDPAAGTLTLVGEARDGRALPVVGFGGTKCYVHMDNNTVTPFTNGPFAAKPYVTGTQGAVEWRGGEDDPLFILAPNSQLVVTTSAVNLGVGAEFWWREVAIPA